MPVRLIKQLMLAGQQSDKCLAYGLLAPDDMLGNIANTLVDGMRN